MNREHVHIWLDILSPALLFLAAQLVLTACARYMGLGEQAGAAASCLLLLPVVFCFDKWDGGRYGFGPIRPLLPWIAAVLLLLLIDGTLLRGTAPAPVLTVIGILGSGICGPICEELVYRGMVCGRSERHLGFRATLLLSSVLFGIAHVGLGAQAWAMIFGAVCYLMRCSFDTLLAPVLTHIILNLAAFLL